ncbi:hypothetical protein JCM19239_5195 [Vibrio variabilis]|uniref:Uncharacterized protein n=1 Tax=Vibrio variabilis TaxID=990271 RepID=A0ABQ0JD67_9VIBR|nr:hypothetical protein JCM19239_5195 [Vibrio variabilis]
MDSRLVATALTFICYLDILNPQTEAYLVLGGNFYSFFE